MFESRQYQLISFGDQEKLESFGGTVVYRQTPSASGRGRQGKRTGEARLRYCLSPTPDWNGNPPDDWHIPFGDTGLWFELRPTPTGQVGLFPEQAVNWDWIINSPADFRGRKALNLFGYTGGTTMSLALRGVQVVHVDAAASVVKWARRNAALSGLESAPIRWIVDDALKFVQRELRRGNRYDIVVADPPSFGRGPTGETWKLSRDLPELLAGLIQLLADQPTSVLLSCHTPGVGHARLAQELELADHSYQRLVGGQWDSFPLTLGPTPAGHILDAGDCVRWMAPS